MSLADTIVARLRIEQGFVLGGIPAGAGVIRLVGLGYRFAVLKSLLFSFFFSL